ncbi:MAG: serine/threonine protein phosphatase [Limimaricola sp.]|uniref:metallophosphoesterase n=1 Tax=Limimaricola sp. TaxID=2211665 RepID=UPI001D4D6CB4|nr:metallophosphoesterase [Limimaricola sp.]MBI1415656.1 serine/threonine protein phosphatase [Limimaricola sp.]
MGFFGARSAAAGKLEKPRRFLSLEAAPTAIYALGDIHGCIDLLRAAEDKIFVDGADLPGQKLIVALGDVIDRGPDSAAVIDHLAGPAPAGFTRLTICGNHEDMFLRFLDDPAVNGRWIAFGGAETLRSYGVDPGMDAPSRAQLRAIARDMNAVLPPGHRAFLEGLPLGLLVGDTYLAHAGYDFALPPARQSADRILWGADPGDRPGPGQSRLVHGHFIVAAPEFLPGRINVDTGAYQSGCLTTLKLSGADGSATIL